MPSRIEDYALIGDCHTAALVARSGSIDWLCFPRFDSGACFAALLGSEEHGHWSINPAEEIRDIRRGYRNGTLVLQTDYETAGGAASVIDCMPPRSKEADLVRIVVGTLGQFACVCSSLFAATTGRSCHGRAVPRTVFVFWPGPTR